MTRVALIALLIAAGANAQEDDEYDPVADAASAAPEEPATDVYEAAPAAAGGAAAFGVRVSGYVDVGWFDSAGDGSGAPAGEARFPVDYAADLFAPAVNSRGEVASLGAGGRSNNAFVPASLEAGGRPTFLCNEINLDLSSQPHPQVLLFASVDLAPRLGARGRNAAVLDIDQAFVRLQPFAAAEWFVTVGRFDSVFGIEYLDNESPLRVGVTPSLMSRYSTGHPLGVKTFFRQQISAISGALSLNVSATNGGPTRDDWSSAVLDLRGRPFVAGRLGLELNHGWGQVKIGGSGGIGPRDDQPDPGTEMRMVAADLRVIVGPVSLAFEGMQLRRDEGGGDKLLGGSLVSRLDVRGGWTTLAVKVPAGWAALEALVPYLRAERRWADFPGFAQIQVDRLTAGLRVDVTERVALKAEGVWNVESEPGEYDNANVDDDVFTVSLVGSL